MTNVTVKEHRKFLKLYKSGKNDYEVARICHVGRNKLREWRNLNGIASKSNKKGLTKEDCGRIISLLKKGQSLTSIGKIYGVYRTSIAKLLKKYGHSYKVRSRPRPKWAALYKLTPIQIEVLIGDMFGDGGIVSKSWKSAYYQTAHSIQQEDFVKWKYEIFSPLSCRIGAYDALDKDSGEWKRYIRMGTWSTNEMKKWFDVFYPEGKGRKLFPERVIREMSWRSLAVWFMGDGTRCKRQAWFSVSPHIDLFPIVESLRNRFGDFFEPIRYEKEWHLKILNPKVFFRRISRYLLSCFNYKIVT